MPPLRFSLLFVFATAGMAADPAFAVMALPHDAEPSVAVTPGSTIVIVGVPPPSGPVRPPPRLPSR